MASPRPQICAKTTRSPKEIRSNKTNSGVQLQRIKVRYLGLALAIGACDTPTGNTPTGNRPTGNTSASVAKAVNLKALPSQLNVSQRIGLEAEVVNEDGSTSGDVLWAFLDDSPSDEELETPLALIWNGAQTPLKYHFYTTRAVFTGNQLIGRYPGTITVVAASMQNPKIRSKAVLQVVAPASPS